ncbi:DEHA2E19976p [Debaryomyces hansenii CBS767]|uniref:Class E vacuolar protein-sorting machinery protein HSE1 n=1 Tax=Debaryomyces hansenii (strain ATCC 36239 / CBS 767 / BCRC 21394 / JCM 1990 / NBRC 0083 / IGC 2968) TaxID=284592 RepID=HSE1_DEBHA|nr:DEHA2E19976p [Debaryomyces hansenii CBS767]Q6BNP6.2 RecName: Full=Class E vacuolar protein-sorting machinery protein HSE1 [Debaryomyces hansenii CBS767]CAG88447.2 DEHA2E19976p [Debaryomyces hansenii CBS767]|eukprot:XP_460174.2 DEHA2E19976p [Debaryomyces hansenii CBS767]
MFGGRQSNNKSNDSLEQLINRATDETLTNDNWQYILDVCDNISSNPEEGTKQGIKVVSSRLASKDANIILRTLSLLVAMAENCGSRMRQEIATTSFVQESLLKKFTDRRLHKTVKFRVAEVIKQLHDSFKTDPSLKPMTDAYNRLVNDYSQYSAETADGPAKPAKKERSRQDKKKEEDELQRVLKLSLQEYEREQTVKKSYLNNKPLPQAQNESQYQEQPRQQQQQQQVLQNQPMHSTPTGQQSTQSPAESQTIATVSKVRALYDLISYEPDELSFRKGDIITVIESVYRDWWRGSLVNGKTGIFPLNYVTPVVTKTPQELSRELDEENRLLAVDSKRIDKLLALLSSNPETINEDEITRLYGDIIPLRTSLGKFIDKYNVRKEELSVLNSQLNNEVKLYNDLMDSSISQRVTHQPSGMSMAPYPTGVASPTHSSFSQANPSMLHQQPTSSGFGNARGNSSNEYFHSQQVPPTSFNQQSQPHSQPQPPQQSGPQRHNTEFSNINNFPNVNNI